MKILNPYNYGDPVSGNQFVSREYEVQAPMACHLYAMRHLRSIDSSPAMAETIFDGSRLRPLKVSV